MNPRQISVFAYLTLLIFAAAIVFFAWQARKFEIDASADTLLEKDNAPYIRMQLAAQRFGSAEFILVAFKPQSGDIFSTDTLKTLQQLSDEIEAMERVTSVRGLPNVPLFADLDSISGDIDPNQLTWQSQRYDRNTLARTLTNHPLYDGLLLNHDQTAVALQVNFASNPELEQLQADIVALQQHLLTRSLSDAEQSHLEDLQAQQDIIVDELDQQRIEEIEHLRALIAQYQDRGQFFLGGGNLLAKQLIDIIRQDLVVFGIAIAAIVMLLLYWIFRRVVWVFLPMLCCTTSVLITLGLLGALGIQITVISANVVALQIILTLALIVHLIVQYRELSRSASTQNHQTLILETMQEKVKPCFYAGLTTSVGFGALIFSGIQPVVSFGWMMIAAMAVTLVISLLFFPALLLVFVKDTDEARDPDFIAIALQKCVSLVERRGKWIGFACGLVFILGVLGCFRLTAENSFLNYFSDSTDVYRELSFIDKEFGGSTPFDLIYTIPEHQRNPDLVITAEAVATVAAIQQRLQDKPAVGNITSIADFTRIAATVRDKPLTEYELTVFYQSLDKELREDLFGAYFSESDHQVRISTRIQDTTEGFNRAQFMRSLHKDMADLGVKTQHYQLSNLFVVYQDILSRLVNSQFITLGIVYLVMGLILLIIFRSVLVAAICLVPNITTTALILGTMGLLNIPMDLMTITIAAVAMGISVDDTIHYVHRFLKEQRINPENPVKQSHLSVGYAMVYTTVIVVVGFSALIFSDFIPSILFGFLTGLAMIVALLTDMTILPVLLKRYRPGKALAKTQPATV
jgi:hypothetical protein